MRGDGEGANRLRPPSATANKEKEEGKKVDGGRGGARNHTLPQRLARSPPGVARTRTPPPRFIVRETEEAAVNNGYVRSWGMTTVLWRDSGVQITCERKVTIPFHLLKIYPAKTWIQGLWLIASVARTRIHTFRSDSQQLTSKGSDGQLTVFEWWSMDQR